KSSQLQGRSHEILFIQQSQLNDKKLRKRSAYFPTNITSRKISHSKNNLKNHLLKCKYGA
ncbi:hypothetical protein, partial [Klebsiella pneumoniae]|uniref:hypothetical protein n=1 Tax=Klebsiella pneumoniae TaxID=573 RepID=UPI0019D64DEF